MEYRHTQVGKTALIVGVWGLIVVLVAALAARESPTAVVVVAGVVALITSVVFVFGRLTVTVDTGTVRAAFGWGWPRRVIEVRDISSFRRVRNKWYYGWGLRKVPGGWMYNVWGLDAVELELHSGRKFRIGTDEADDLVAALSAYTMLRPGDPA